MSIDRFEQKLNSGWRWAKLSDVCEVVTGSTPPKGEERYYGGSIPWIKPDNLGKSMYVEESTEYLTEEGGRAARLLPPGSVLVSCIGNLGKLAIAGKVLATNQQINSLIPTNEIDSEFLFFVCSTLQKQLNEVAAVTIVPIVNKSAFSSLKIILPPIPDQRRIAAGLKAQLATVEEARNAAQAQVDEVEALWAAVYREAFAEIVPVAVPPKLPDAPESWRWEKLLNLAKLESGHTPSRFRPDWWGGDVSWVSLTEIRALDGSWTKETKIKTNEDGIANSASRILPRGTVCYSRTASVGFVTIMDSPMATSQDFANWVCGDNLDPEFLMHALIRSRSELRAIATGATHKTIYMPTLKEFYICLPEKSEQMRIVRQLKMQLDVVKELRAAAQAKLEGLEKLPSRLLAKAFNIHR